MEGTVKRRASKSEGLEDREYEGKIHMRLLEHGTLNATDDVTTLDNFREHKCQSVCQVYTT